MAFLISGIGRSGTTTLYQILGKGFLSKYRDARCVYEPYLWDIPEVEHTAQVKGQPFNVGQVGLFNKYVHCNTPLFLSDGHELHDVWLDRVFRPIDSQSGSAPDNVLVKVIRGSGRLEAALNRFQNLKTVIVTRNVVDTVNSGLGLFSFSGDEFHRSDKDRFVGEINRAFNADIDSSLVENELQWSVLWWRYFTEASIRTCVKFPDRVMLLPYEEYLKNKPDMMKKIFEFAGIDRLFMDQTLFDIGAGPQTKVSYLNSQNINQMADHLNWYLKEISEKTSFRCDSDSFRRGLISKYNGRKFVKSLCLHEKTDLTAVQWRIKLLEYKNKSGLSSAGGNVTPNHSKKLYTVAHAVAEFGANEDSLAQVRIGKPTPHKTMPVSRSIGVLITCYNNEDTIAEAIYSVLCQSKKPDIIVVADDRSLDGSVSVIEKVAAEHKIIKIIQRSENVGVAANRDLAIRAMDTDYITTLDGDDLFLPGKIELENHVLDGAIDKVAYSNVAVLGADNHFVQDTTPYSGRSKQKIITMLTSRSVPVPRDMMFSRTLFEKADGFDVGMEIYEDWSFKMRLMAMSKNSGWVHSGGNGTVYDRRNPGLSGKTPIQHAYGQLLTLSRNAEVLKDYPNALICGHRNIAKHLNGKVKDRFSAFIDQIDESNDIGRIVTKLSVFWQNATFRDGDESKYKHIWRFASI